MYEPPTERKTHWVVTINTHVKNIANALITKVADFKKCIIFFNVYFVPIYIFNLFLFCVIVIRFL